MKPYVQTNESDFLDAEAIAEAVQRPRMRFLPIKTEEELDLQAPYCGGEFTKYVPRVSGASMWSVFSCSIRKVV